MKQIFLRSSSFFITFLLLVTVNLVILKANTVVIPIEGEIEPSVYKFLKRALNDATNQQNQAKQIIIKINTFGGELNTTFQIVELLSAVELPLYTVVEEKAVSAGTLIAMAAKEIYMISNSIMGDVAPIAMSAEGPTMLGEKFQSPLRAKFRALAQKNGYPVKLSEAFVSTDKEIIEVEFKDGSKKIMDGVEYGDLSEQDKNKIKNKKTLVPNGELLTMSAEEAVNLGFSKRTVASIAQAVELINAKVALPVLEGVHEIITIQKRPAEDAFMVFLKYSWILILLGLAGVYLEVQNPGFGFYGIIAIIAFMVFFIGQYLVELATYVEFIALLLGLGFLAIEILILPGFGIFGVLGMILLLGSLVMMRQSFFIPQDVFEWELLTQNAQLVLIVFAVSLVTFVLSFMLTPRYMRKSPLVFSAKLFENHNPVVGNDVVDHTNFGVKIGDRGQAITTLSPSGRVVINGQRLDAVIKNDYIRINDEVKVIGYDGYLVVVEKV